LNLPLQIPRAYAKARRVPAFTLVEMLVAVAVLTLLMVALAQIISDMQRVSTASTKHLKADSESRMVFDRIAEDLGRMVRRTDVDYLLNHSANNNNDSLFFYSEAPAFSSATIAEQNSVALTGYRINPAYQLERLADGLTWHGITSAGMVFLTYASYPLTAASTPLPASTLAGAFPNVVAANSTDSNYHVLGEDVFRLEFCYLLKPCTDTSGKHQPAIYSNSPYDTRAGHSSMAGIGLTDVQALVVGVAVLDSASRQILPAGTTLNTAAGLLGDVSDADLAATPPKLMATTWQGEIDSGAFAQNAGLPKVAANQVRVYQRLFPLNPVPVTPP